MSATRASEKDGGSRRLMERLESLRQALGADRLGLARRPPVLETPPFEVLGAVDGGPAPPPPARALPPLGFHRLLSEARPLRVECGDGGPLARWLRRHGARRLLGWPLPLDRLPSVLLLALYRSDRDPGPQRLQVALAGMDALARTLAPPDFLPMPPPPSPDAPDCLPLRGASPAAVRLRTEVGQIVARPEPALLWGEEGCGARRAARALHRLATGGNPPLRELAAEGPPAMGAEPLRSGEWALLLEPQRWSAARQEGLMRWLSRLSDDARLLTVMHADPRRERRAGRLRGDLSFALATHELRLPSLRERGEDLLELWRGLARERGLRPVPEPTDAAARQMLCHAWPGNLLELEREIARVAALHPGARRLTVPMLGDALRRQESGPPVLPSDLPLRVAIARVERQLLRQALRLAEGNKTVAARHLELSRQGLYRKLHRHGLLEDAD